jgi:hypothetical protein
MEDIMTWEWILIVAAALLGLVALMAFLGALLSRHHVASRQGRFQQPPEALWTALTDIAAFPTWRPEVKRVERLPDRDGRPMWRETWAHETITFEQVEAQPPRRLVGRIADTNLAFGGSWTYEITPTDRGSILTITENGEVYNPIFRFLARFVFGYHATMEKYLKALGKKFGEDVVPEPVS